MGTPPVEDHRLGTPPVEDTTGRSRTTPVDDSCLHPSCAGDQDHEAVQEKADELMLERVIADDSDLFARLVSRVVAMQPVGMSRTVVRWRG